MELIQTYTPTIKTVQTAKNSGGGGLFFWVLIIGLLGFGAWYMHTNYNLFKLKKLKEPENTYSSNFNF